MKKDLARLRLVRRRESEPLTSDLIEEARTVFALVDEVLEATDVDVEIPQMERLVRVDAAMNALRRARKNGGRL